MSNAVRTILALGALVAAAPACGPARTRPVSYPDPEVPCPGGRLEWGLQVLDRRVDREATERAMASVSDAIRGSFPGCRWTEPGLPGSDQITIEIHRLSSVQDPGGSWEAAAEWTVTVRDAAGGIVTEFEARQEDLRPNYTGTDNESESLNKVFREAVERTVKGLAGIRNLSAARPLAGTPSTARGGADAAPSRA